MTNLLEITEASRSELVEYLGYTPAVYYDFEVRRLARAKYYADKGWGEPDLNLPTYDFD